jgi:segregation and condensation protein A
VLQQLAEEQRHLFSRTTVVPHLAFARPDAALAGNPDGFSLWAALQEVLARAEAAGPTVREVARAKVTVRQQMVRILKSLEASPGGFLFQQLFLTPEAPAPTRVEVIITFLALLELMRLHHVLVTQDELFGKIYVRLASTDTATRRSLHPPE